MKKLSVLLIVLLFLGGCSGKQEELERAMTLRAKILASECSFDAKITADYGDKLHTFAMHCTGDNDGNIEFTVTKPETLSGITGRVSSGDGELTFDDVALEFPLLADGQVTPVSGPWILWKTLLGGYLTGCGQEGDYLRVSIDDSYADDALTLDIYLDHSNVPVQADVIWENRRILTMQIRNFQIG